MREYTRPNPLSPQVIRTPNRIKFAHDIEAAVRTYTVGFEEGRESEVQKEVKSGSSKNQKVKWKEAKRLRRRKAYQAEHPEENLSYSRKHRGSLSL